MCPCLTFCHCFLNLSKFSAPKPSAAGVAYLDKEEFSLCISAFNLNFLPVLPFFPLPGAFLFIANSCLSKKQKYVAEELLTSLFELGVISETVPKNVKKRFHSLLLFNLKVL